MIDRKQSIAADFSAAASQYNRHAILQQWVAQKVAERAAAVLNSTTAPLLDAGCGTGFVTAALRELGVQNPITGVDVAYAMCQQAYATLQTVCADVEALPFREAGFHGIVSSLAWQWLREPRIAFAECRRVLSAGGVGVFSTFSEGTLHELASAFADAGLPPHLNAFLPVEKVIAQAEEAGFRLAKHEEEATTEWFTSPQELLRQMHHIGAGFKDNATPLNAGQLRRVCRLYTGRFGEAGRIPATWRIAYLLLEAA